MNRRVVLLLLGVIAAACLSPTLPLPPPGDPEVESAGQGVVVLSGSVPEPGVPVIARNMRTTVYAGRNADETGAYRFPIAAESGDVLSIYYEVNGLQSEKNEFQVPSFELEEPDAVATAPDASGVSTVSGISPEPLAHVFVSNPATEITEAVASDEEGRFLIEIEAESGDQLEVWYKFGSNFSPVVVVEVPDA